MFKSFIFITLICGGCATTGAVTAPETSEAFEPIYGIDQAQLPSAETVALGTCQYSVPIPDIANQVSVKGNALDFDFHGAVVTVRLVRPGAELVDVLAAVYRREVNELEAPFYGYTTGARTRDEVSASFGFIVRNVNTPKVLGTIGFTKLRLDPQSGRILVFTAAWPFEAYDFKYESQLHDLADRQHLSCT